MSEAQPKWLEKAKITYKYHRDKMLSNDDWTVTMTARALRRAYGSIAEDLLIARWCRSHEKELEKFVYAYQALEFIREKKKEQERQGLD